MMDNIGIIIENFITLRHKFQTRPAHGGFVVIKVAPGKNREIIKCLVYYLRSLPAVKT